MAFQNSKQELINLTSNIVIIPLNMDAINKDIDESIKREAAKAGDSTLAPKIKPNEYFGLRGKLGIVKGANFLIDNECIGDISGNPSVDIYSEMRDENGGFTSFTMTPSFTTKMNIEDTIKSYGGAEVSLQEFMDTRFAYNSRVCSNMRILVKEINKKK